jgi:hypothetical protein
MDKSESLTVSSQPLAKAEPVDFLDECLGARLEEDFEFFFMAHHLFHVFVRLSTDIQ